MDLAPQLLTEGGRYSPSRDASENSVAGWTVLLTPSVGVAYPPQEVIVMAFTRCALHGKMYTGGSNTFFLRLVNGNEQHGGKMPMCKDCAELTMVNLAARMIHVSQGEEFLAEPESKECANCKAPINGSGWAFFGNAYPRGEKPSQWYGQVCETCLPAVMEDFGISA